jgi:hypothetical protein
MDNQCFVPPPEDGATFIGSAINFATGQGIEFVIWLNESSFFRLSILFLSVYYALVCVFAAILVQLDKKTEGRCGLDADQIWDTS